MQTYIPLPLVSEFDATLPGQHYDAETGKDARGITATYGYDALNRLTSIQYPVTAEDVSYSYDQGANGVGRLTGIADASGTTKDIGVRANIPS